MSIPGIFYLGCRSAREYVQLNMKGVYPLLTRTSPPSPHTQISGSHQHCSWENPAILVVVKAELNIRSTKHRAKYREFYNKLI